MHAVLDHLTAVLVGTVTTVLLLAVALSARETAVEASAFYAAREHTLAFVEVVQQDLANVGADVAPALPAVVAWEPGAPTAALEFRGAVAPQADAPVEQVRYEVTAVDTAEVTAGGGVARLPLYRVDRLVLDGGGYRPDGGSPPTLAAFEVRLLRDGAPLPAGAPYDTADEVELRVAAVSPLGDDGAVGLTRWESRYALANLGADPADTGVAAAGAAATGVVADVGAAGVGAAGVGAPVALAVSR